MTDYKDSNPNDGKWFKPYGVTTPRVDTRIPKQASDYSADAGASKVPVEDRGKRTVSDGDDTIWAAYEAGY